MKTLKILVLILALTLAAWTAAEPAKVTGMIIEQTENGFAFSTEEGIRFAALSEQTVTETDGELAVGDVVTVTFSGRTDRRMLNADSVVCRKLIGTVESVEPASEEEEAYFLLNLEDGQETVRVNLDEISSDRVIPGLPVTVYYSGAMTRSIPPQITAQYVRGTVLRGEITDVTEDGQVTLETEDGETVILHCSEETLVFAELTIGSRVSVSVAPQVLLSLPAQYGALDILPIS